MHPQLAAALSRLDQVRDEIRALVHAAPVPVRSQKPAPERWSINEVVEHVGKVEELFVGALIASIDKARAAGLGAEVETPPLLAEDLKAVVEDRSTPRVAPEHVRPTGSVDAMASVATIEGSHQRLREALTAAEGLALSAVTFEHRIFGALNVYQWVDFIAGHERRHLAQLREVTAQLTTPS